MIPSDLTKNTETLCNLNYLSEMVGGKNHLITGIIDAFLKQIPEELAVIKDGIEKGNYATIKNFAHTMKSSVSIMGITILTPILLEMENLGGSATDMGKIKELNQNLISICKKALAEIESEKHNYA